MNLGCQNQHQLFCQEAASSLCEKCMACGADGLRHCGMLNGQSVTQCVDMMVSVCDAYDGVFNRELSRTCLERIDTLSCSQLRQEGKPDVCNRLF